MSRNERGSKKKLGKTTVEPRVKRGRETMKHRNVAMSTVILLNMRIDRQFFNNEHTDECASPGGRRREAIPSKTKSNQKQHSRRFEPDATAAACARTHHGRVCAQQQQQRKQRKTATHFFFERVTFERVAFVAFERVAWRSASIGTQIVFVLCVFFFFFFAFLLLTFALYTQPNLYVIFFFFFFFFSLTSLFLFFFFSPL